MITPTTIILLEDFSKMLRTTSHVLKLQESTLTEDKTIWDSNKTNFPMTETKAVEIPLQDQTPWEYFRYSSTDATKFAVTAQSNWINFFRLLPPVTEPIAIPEKPLKPRALILAGVEQRNLEGFKPIAESCKTALELQGYDAVYSGNVNAAKWLEALHEGADALFVVSHGDSVAGIVTLEDGAKSEVLFFADLESVLQENPRLLRCLVVFACGVRQALVDMLVRLQQKRKLHPQFGAVLAWGEPDSSEAEDFLGSSEAGFFQKIFSSDPPTETAFFDAVRAGRMAIKTCPARPFVVVSNYQAQPLPNAVQLEIESAMCDLIAAEPQSF
jgi:hypothetical protein